MQLYMEASLRQKLIDIKKRIREIEVTVDAIDVFRSTYLRPVNSTSPQVRQEEPVLSIRVPKSLFVLWDQYIKKCKKLKQSPGSLTACVGELTTETSLTSLNCQEPTLEKRINTEFSRFISSYRKMGGAKRKTELQNHTKISVFKHQLHMPTEKAQLVLCNSGKKFVQLNKKEKESALGAIKSFTLNTIRDPLEQVGLQASSIKIKSIDSNKEVEMRLDNNNDEPGCNDDEEKKKLLYLLTKHGISFEFYHELTMMYPSLVKSYKIKEFKKTIDTETPKISRTPGQLEGSQYNFHELLKKVLLRKVKSEPESFVSNIVKIKISGDGARFTHHTSYVLLSFSILNGDCGSIHKSNNVYTLAAVKSKEDYDSLSESLQDCFDSINKLIKHPFISLEGRVFKLDIYLCCDYKFTLTILGLNEAHAEYACVWCKISSNKRWDMSVDLDEYTNPEQQGRTIEEIKTTVSSSIKPNYGCIRAPLIDLPLDHVIPDELHMMLRITDILIQNLINAATSYDRNINDIAQTNILQGPMLCKLVEEVQDCGVPFVVRVANTKKKNVEFNSLLGEDRKKLLKLLPTKLQYCQPDTFSSIVKDLWKKFADLYYIVSSDEPSETPSELHKRASEWIKLFTSLAEFCDGYANGDVTPYMHILVVHVPSLMKKCKSIKQFTCQAVEKNNDISKRIFFTKSNKWNPTKDILKIQYQVKAMEQTCKRRKRQYNKSDPFWEDKIKENRKKLRLETM